jgi:hypothetical protein
VSDRAIALDAGFVEGCGVRLVSVVLLVVPLMVVAAACDRLGPALSGSPVGREAAGDPEQIPLTVMELPGGSIVVLVDVFLRGEGPYTFVLDTGASLSAVNRPIVEHLDLPDAGAGGLAIGIIEAGFAGLVQVDQWRMGGVDLEPGRLVVLDLPEVPADLSLDGLIGSDVLSRYGAVTIDYEQRQLTLRTSQ